MPSIVTMYSQGAPDVLRHEQTELTEPSATEVRVRQEAIGINYLDLYLRSGDIPVNTFPFINGFEAAGVIEAVGAGVREWAVGDRVAYQLVGGAYASARNMAPDRLVRLPSYIGAALAAAVMLKGTTAELLLHRVHAVGPGDTVLVQAAAGGVGSMLTQWANALGATVIGTVGSADKRQQALSQGCDFVFVTKEDDFVEGVLSATGGEGVSVVYDGVGGDAFIRNVEVLRRYGKVVMFGWAGGRVPPVDIHLLNSKSLSIVNPSVGHYTASRADMELSTHRLFEAIRSGKVSVTPNEYALRDAAQAHHDIETRMTRGSVILVPSH